MTATTSQELMVQADLATKGHARIRNTALLRLHSEYGLDCLTISKLTGIKDRTVRNAIFRRVEKLKTERPPNPLIDDYEAELVARTEEVCASLIAVVAESMADDVSEDTRQAIANIVEGFCAKVDEL